MAGKVGKGTLFHTAPITHAADELDYDNVTSGISATDVQAALDEIHGLVGGGGYTDEEAQDAIGTILTDTASIDFTYDDVTPTISAVALPAGIDHDQLLNYAANEHFTEASIDHGSISGLADDDHTQYLNETRHDALAADNPHSVTFTQAVASDGGTDISAAEAETLTDGSNADSLHEHLGSSLEVGTPTDGDITDGLFGWTTATTITDALDDVNELLVSLSPPPAPDLDDIDIDANGVDGKLSFGATDSLGGYTNVTGIGSRPSADVDDDFLDSGDRAGIFDNTPSDFTGTLNEDVSAGPGSPTAAYPANAFADVGQTLSLEINGVVTNTVDLSSTDAAINQGSSTSGFNVSAKTANKFPNGDSSTLFFYRTGSWRIDSADSNLRLGWNYVRVLDDQGSPVSTNYVDWVQDGDTTATSFSSEALDTLSMAGSKHLSGVEYHTSGTAQYDITIDNAYRNTYSRSSSAVNHNPTNCSISDASLGAQSGNEAATVTITNKTATINATRIIDGSISVSTTLDRTLNSDLTSSGVSITGILMDNASASPTNTFEDFDDEGYRLPSNVSLTSTSYSSGPDNGPVTWDETISLVSATAGYSDGLQVYNDRLEYPDFNWGGVTNGPAGNPDYSSASGDRVYLRYFYDASSRQNFVFDFDVTSTSFVSVATGPSGNNLTCEILAPNTTQDGGSTVEFKDMVVAYTDDDSIGAFSSSVGATIPTDWGVTLGTRSTSTSGNAWVIRITASSGWTGRINDITCTPQ